MIVTYQPVLVLLSIGVAILGSLTALALTAFSDDSDVGAGQRSIVLTCGGLIMGATIWSMHFVAMMAVDFPIIVTYNLIETIASIAIAITTSILSKRRMRRRSSSFRPTTRRWVSAECR